MNAKIEQELQNWYEKMEASPGLYDGRREISDDGSIGPQERLQEMFLKRLDGFNIGLAVTQTEEFGEVVIADFQCAIDFDMERLRAEGMTSVLPFRSKSKKGISGVIRLDWQHSTMVFVPDEGEPSVYVVNDYLQSWMVGGVGHKLNMGFLCVISPLVDDGTQEREFLSNMNLNKMYVEGLILAKRDKANDGLFHTQTGVTFRDIAEVTGVSPSTLSDLRNGKKSFDNLTWKTLSVLSFYAQIRMLDAHIVGMMREQLAGKYVGVAPETEDSGLTGVVVELTDETTYRMEAWSIDSVDALFTTMVELYNDEKRSVILPAATNTAGETFTKLMVPKNDIKQIRIEEFVA